MADDHDVNRKLKEVRCYEAKIEESGRGKFSPSGKNPCMLSGFLTLNAESILPQAGNKGS